MRRDKQIEEMAEIMVSKPSCIGLPCTKCEFNHKTNCMNRFVASYLYEDGYRKASDGVWGFDGMGFTCSECGEYALLDKYKQAVHSDFCPNCGAKMKGE